MRDEKTNSWIFLAVGMASNDSPITFNSVIDIADGINHAVPTHKELQNAFKWLLNQELLSKEGKKYRITDKGMTLLEKAESASNLIFGQWDYIEKQFLILSSQNENKET